MSAVIVFALGGFVGLVYWLLVWSLKNVRAKMGQVAIDYSIDITPLNSHEKAKVMVRRPECPIDLSGLDSFDKAWVMVNRRDCSIDLSGLRSRDKAWVMGLRDHKGWPI